MTDRIRIERHPCNRKRRVLVTYRYTIYGWVRMGWRNA